jgi:uncharacterized protein YgbK (DUF1537 family)
MKQKKKKQNIPPILGEKTRGRKPLDKAMRRVVISGSCAAATGEQIRAWVKSRCNVKPMSHVGHVMDAMREHCLETNFNPTK